MTVWSEVSPGMIAFSRARVRVCHGVCVHRSFMERGGENDLTAAAAAAAAAVTPAGHDGADGAPRRQMLAQTRLHTTKACMPAHAPPPFTKSFLPITALAYTRFHADCGPPMHLLPRPSRPSHALASMPVTQRLLP